MKSLTKSLTTILSVLLATAASLVFFAGSQSAHGTDDPSVLQPAQCNILLSSAVPPDAIIPDSHKGNPTAEQVDFDTLSWNTFIALNWPADPNNNGKPDPDPTKKIGLEDYSPVVWETYKESYDIFLADASGNPVKPAAWNTPPQPPPGCDSNQTYAKKLGRPIRVIKNISKNGLNEFLQAFEIGPLIDQKGAFARYEILVNEFEFNQIMNPANPITGLVSPPLWDSRNQTNVSLTVGKTGGPEGPIEVKAAWKVIGPNDNPNRYHTQLVQIAWPVATKPSIQYKCSQPILMGLVALHIAHKTFNAPQWAWASFEQVDNYRAPQGAPFGAKASFSNPDCPPKTCPANQVPNPPAAGWNGDPSVLNQAPSTQVVPGKSARFKASCNDVAQQLLLSVYPNTVWQYYRLVTTQWPQTPYMNGKPSVVYDPPTLQNQGANQTPVSFTNAVVETYFMGPPESSDTGSCMACHNDAKGLVTNQPLDFSYALQEAYPFSPSSIANLRGQRKAFIRPRSSPARGRPRPKANP
jgi:hypothetical protein